jgi:hypothetical protein
MPVLIHPLLHVNIGHPPYLILYIMYIRSDYIALALLVFI